MSLVCQKIKELKIILLVDLDKEERKMPRSQFDQELNKMHVDLDRMCHLVVLAIENCVTAFKEQDYELARDIIHGDKQINDVERSIEAKCLSLILKQQPVASDLRDVSTALKVVTDLERIGIKVQILLN